MTTLPHASRRDLLRGMAAIPLLPVVGASAQSFLFPRGAKAATPTSVEFIGMDAPKTAAAQATTTVESALRVAYDDGTEQTYQLGYQPLFLTGDEVPDGNGGTVIAGGLYDVNNQPVMDATAPTPTQLYSDCPDGYSVFKVPGASVPGVTGNPVFGVIQFEYTSRDAADNNLYGKLHSPIAVVTYDQNPETGQLSLVKYSPVDESAVHGLWITCGGSLSPWGTHLSSEEYEPDATIAATHEGLRYFSQHFFGDPDAANPYHYGHLPEVIVNPDGTGRLVKHYNTGRISHEITHVMPDQRTAIMGDDWTHGGIFLFVADRPADLSAGTLYVAKLDQQPGVLLDAGGSFDVSWIKLGHATSDEIEQLADTLKVGEIVDVRTEDPGDPSFTAIHFSGKPQWVKFVPGMELAAPFLETHRYAAAVGGTLATTKLEGVTVNEGDKIAYLAMSSVYRSMTDGTAGIQVGLIDAGAVYQEQLAGGQVDTGGEPIDSEWVPITLSAVPALVGLDLAEPDPVGNTADVDRVANPDAVKYSERLRTLFIGEDSGMHVNNFLWAYNVDTQQLSRILSNPVGAESTGTQAIDDLNGFMYIMSNFQHVGDWDDELHAVVRPEVEPLINSNYRNRRSSTLGYITGLPKSA